jgi:hypothetical protein
MSAALQLPMLCAAGTLEPIWPETEAHDDDAGCLASSSSRQNESLAFYRSHTERMLRRYLYASMQIGRSPSILSEPIGRGWASSCRVKTFEDAVIFVMDIEQCINHLGSLDRELLSKIVIQEYTQVEAANLLGMSVRAVGYKFPEALDHLTEFLLASHLLILSD